MSRWQPPGTARLGVQVPTFVVVVVAYVTLGLLGAVEISGFFALTALWLPAAIGPAVIARWPDRWPAVLAAVIAGEVAVDTLAYSSNAYETFIWVTGNVLASVVGASVLIRLRSVDLRRPGQLVGLVTAAVASAATFSAVSTLIVPGQLSFGSFIPLTAGDTAGFVVMAPSILMVGRQSLVPRRTRAIVLAAVLVAGSCVFLSTLWVPGSIDPWQVLVFVALLFASIGCGIEVVSLAVPALVLISFWGTRAGRGPFAAGETPSSTSLLQTQLFVVVVTLALYAGSIMWDRYRLSARDEARSRAMLAAVISGLPARVHIEETGWTSDAERLPSDQPDVESVMAESGRFERVHRFDVVDGAAHLRAHVEVAFDVTAEHVREGQMRAMFDRSPVALARVSPLGVVLEANAALLSLLGTDLVEVVGVRVDDLLLPPGHEPSKPVFDGGDVLDRDVQLRRADRREVWVSLAATAFPGTSYTDAFHLMSFDDVTARRAQELALRHRAHHDPLTGLPNREALMERLAAALEGPARDISLLFCDLDDLKRVNDTLGHPTGDQLLCEAARRLVSCAPDDGLVARFGGDEFVIVLLDHEAGQLEACGERIRRLLREPLLVDGRDLSATVSIGIATSSAPHSISSSDLVRRADLAMYQAKGTGRDRAVAYTPGMESRAHRALAIEADLRDALNHGGLRAHLQHIVSAGDRSVVNVEVLARLTGERKIGPGDFIQVAESMGVMSDVSRAVLTDAFAAMRRVWGSSPLGVSVNASPREVARDSYPGWLLAQLGAQRVDPRRVTVEITESVALDSSGVVRRVVEQLRAEGVSIAIDDFGTGYSSLSALRDLPVDVVKLDRSFVSGLPHQLDALAICRGVIAVAHEMGIVVVGEGVETTEQLDCLEELGCDRVQGYSLHRPAPAAEVVDGLVATALSRSG